MKCKSCGFLVPQNLKFAIMKNFCPQCGEKLFSDKEMNHLSMIQSRVMKQEFSSDFDEDMAFDVTLFVYNEITNGYGRVILDDEVQTIIKSDTEVNPGSKDSHVDEKEIQKQIRAEEAARVQSESIVNRATIEDEDDKVKRLKSISKIHNANLKGPSVRRLGGDS